MRWIGQLALLGAFVATGYSACACVLGWRNRHRAMARSGWIAGIASFLTLSLVMAALLYGLLVKDFGFAYVAQYSNRHLPWYYSASSLWVGQAGSLLLWSWFSVSLALLFRMGGRHDFQASSLRDPAFGVLMGFCCFLVGTMVFAADPMAASLTQPDDGAGLSPILQHPSMLIHPPIVFLGFAAWGIPFSLAMAALATGQLDSEWTRAARPWALFAWMVLGSGILIGARWAYDELGWGGYWGWDPVENGSLLPWLFGTASLHTLMAWRQRGMFKKTALILTITTFGMCNFATFLTRSGIFSSLHAFSESPIGWLFLGLMSAITFSGASWILLRRHRLVPERSLATLWCRESMVATSTLAFVSLAVVVCIGTLSTAISDAMIGRKIVLGVEFYNNALIPTGLVVLLLTASAPLIPWGKPPSKSQIKLLCAAAGVGVLAGIATIISGVREIVWITVNSLAIFSVASLLGAWGLDAGTFPGGFGQGWLRALQVRRRLYAGFVIHMGLFSLAIGVTASSYGTQRHEAIMHEGETLDWAGRHVRLVEIVQRELPEKLIVEARLEVQSGSGRRVVIAPAQHFHFRQKEWTTEVGNDTSWSGDFYTMLHSGEGENGVRLTFVDNPMMRWIWLGGCIMAIGATVAIWPVRQSTPSQATRRVNVSAARRRRPSSVHGCVVE